MSERCWSYSGIRETSKKNLKDLGHPSDRSFMKKNLGSTLIEYSLLLALIAVVAVSAIAVLGNRVAESYCNSSGAFSEESNSGTEQVWIDGECVMVTEALTPDCTADGVCI